MYVLLIFKANKHKTFKQIFGTLRKNPRFLPFEQTRIATAVYKKKNHNTI